MSALLQENVQSEAGSRARVRTVTARFGASYITDEASYTVAAHSALEAWTAALAQPQPAPSAVLIGCFGDPGLWALREGSRVEVHEDTEGIFIRHTPQAHRPLKELVRMIRREQLHVETAWGNARGTEAW